jgi:hypothetical protein
MREHEDERHIQVGRHTPDVATSVFHVSGALRRDERPFRRVEHARAILEDVPLESARVPIGDFSSQTPAIPK